MKIVLVITAIVMLLILFLSYSIRMGKLIDQDKSNSYFNKLGTLYFSRDGNWFSLGYHKMNADAKSFTVLSNTIGKDKNSVFSNGKAQDLVDYATFEVVNQVFKDKNHVYEPHDYGELKPIEIQGLDVESFEYLEEINRIDYGWSKDKNQYYFKGQIVPADFQSLTFLTKDFFYDKNKLYAILLKEIKPIKTIEKPPKTLTKKYITSGNSIYYVGINEKKETVLKTIDFTGEQSDLKTISDNVIGVNNQLVSYGDIITGADVPTYELIQDDGHRATLRYHKDKNHVYLDNKVIEKANPQAFRVLGFGYSADDQHVYWLTTIVEGADAKSFRAAEDHNYQMVDDNGNRYNLKGKRIELSK